MLKLARNAAVLVAQRSCWSISARRRRAQTDLAGYVITAVAIGVLIVGWPF